MPMPPMSGKYIRYILFAVIAIIVVHFIASSSLPVPNAKDLSSALNPAKPTSTLAPYSGVKDVVPSAASTKTEGTVQTTIPIKKPDEKPHETLQLSDAPVSSPQPKKENATFVTLARNSDLWDIVKSIREVEDRFNRDHGYDWVFLNDKEFDDEFIKVTSALTSGKTHYGLIPDSQWGFPDHISEDKAAETREKMKNIIYGDSISYRHMCRYESGFFFRHELMQKFDYYWRVEPSVDYYCNIPFDPFKFMRENGKKYSFVISLYEYKDTIPTIWSSVRKWMEKNPQYIAEDNSIDFISNDGGKSYNLCHFWSNFEIGDLNWLRSDAYINFFDSLDHDGGFYYERWGDAPVHSIAAALTLNKSEVHFFDEIGYYHVPFHHCPTDEKMRLNLKCTCKPSDNFDWKGYSCTSRFFDTHKLDRPLGWRDQA